MHRSVGARLLAAVALAFGFALVPSAQDRPARAGVRALISDLTAPGIDRGVRDNDPPRPPRTAAARREPFVRGSVLVKFREGVSPFARTAMLSRVNAAAARALDHADFEIVTIDPAADPEAIAAQLSSQPDV